MTVGKTDLADLSQHNVCEYFCLSVSNECLRAGMHLDPTWLVKKFIIPIELTLK